MDEDDRIDVLRRLLEHQHALRSVVEAAGLQGALAREIGRDRFALAAFMLQEALISYSQELGEFVREYIGESD